MFNVKRKKESIKLVWTRKVFFFKIFWYGQKREYIYIYIYIYIFKYIILLIQTSNNIDRNTYTKSLKTIDDKTTSKVIA